MGQTPRNRLPLLGVLAGVVGIGILALTWKVFEPLLFASPPPPTEQKVALPAYDYKIWGSWPVQDGGRVKPFATAAIEAVRQITGRQEFEHKDPTAIMLQWLLLNGTSTNPEKFTDWENYPFILCEQQDLRKIIYAHLEADGKKLTDQQLHGKYIAPVDLRTSPGFSTLLDEAETIRKNDEEKAQQLFSPAQRKAEEVAHRLMLFDSIAQNNPASRPRERQYKDPMHVVALDRVQGGAWFAVGELRQLENANGGKVWTDLLSDRLAHMPQLYIAPERQQALREFQQQVKNGTWQKAIDELAAELKARTEKRARDFEETDKKTNGQYAKELLSELMASRGHEKLSGINMEDKDQVRSMVAQGLRSIGTKRDEEQIAELKRRIQSAKAQGYHPDKPEFRMLHLNYLEARFPDVYKESLAWQTYPANDVSTVLGIYNGVRTAYLSGDPAQFAKASQEFLTTTKEVSEKYGPYPGEDTASARWLGMFTMRAATNPAQSLLNLERTYDRVQPFMWAWILMLGSLCCFIGHLALGSRASYLAGFVFFFASLGFQLFGFYTRVAIAGRPPVSNMYETVVWVAFMSSIFALILELIYRRGVIALAGAMVATLGLVLADQLPLVLDPKISPLTPVLRSNYWLTIHVLTIVSSYAGGTLAWGLGNISLALLAFGQPRRELLKTLSQFSYRAMQIAVLLLAAGTFLGGWWAAESWGRFWGWDPKEVWALIALVCYVIPLHMRYIGWVKDFGLAVSAVLCYAVIVMSWYGVNFVLAAGLHSYGFGGGGPWWVFWAGLLNVEWVIIASMLYLRKVSLATPTLPA
jgi:ABC-type transport system involved in cytochrome c biogenesis permease subunit